MCTTAVRFCTSARRTALPNHLNAHAAPFLCKGRGGEGQSRNESVPRAPHPMRATIMGPGNRRRQTASSPWQKPFRVARMEHVDAAVSLCQSTTDPTDRTE